MLEFRIQVTKTQYFDAATIFKRNTEGSGRTPNVGSEHRRWSDFITIEKIGVNDLVTG